MPSLAATLRAMAKLSALETVSIPSITPRSSTPGTKPAPMPWILCGPGAPPERTGLSSGSTAIIRTEGFSALSA